MKYTERLKPSDKTTVLSLSWRDIKSPTAGGAEVHTHEMLSGMDMNHYRVIHHVKTISAREYIRRFLVMEIFHA